MKWFTREWQDGHLSDAQADERQVTYTTYLDTVAERLPPGVLRLARPRTSHESVKDARVDRMVVDEPARRVSMRLLNGELDVGYGKLYLEFTDAELVYPPPAELEIIVSDPRTEIPSHRSRDHRRQARPRDPLPPLAGRRPRDPMS